MSTFNVIFIIYLLGVFFNFGRIVEANANRHYAIKDNIIPFLYSFLSWLLEPISYCYKKIKTMK